MWWPNHIPAGVQYHEMMSHIDCWATLAAMVSLRPPPHEWVGNDGKGIYFDSIDNSAYILGRAQHSARDSWIYIDGENFNGARADIGGDPKEPWVHIGWKYLFTVKDSWLGANAELGSIGALYNLTMDPYERYDMVFNVAGAELYCTESRADFTSARTTTRLIPTSGSLKPTATRSSCVASPKSTRSPSCRRCRRLKSSRRPRHRRRKPRSRSPRIWPPISRPRSRAFLKNSLDRCNEATRPRQIDLSRRPHRFLALLTMQ
jgi:hypothetical protein